MIKPVFIQMERDTHKKIELEFLFDFCKLYLLIEMNDLIIDQYKCDTLDNFINKHLKEQLSCLLYEQKAWSGNIGDTEQKKYSIGHKIKFTAWNRDAKITGINPITLDLN